MNGNRVDYKYKINNNKEVLPKIPFKEEIKPLLANLHLSQ